MRNLAKIKNSFIQLLYFSGALVIAVAIFSSSLCIPTKSNFTTSLVSDINNAKFKNETDLKNAKNLTFLIQFIIRDMQLGQLAQKKASLIDVRELGKINEKFNTKKLVSAINMARSKSISIPSTTAESEELFFKLADLSSESFEKRYCDLMVKNYTERINLCKIIILETSDPLINTWAKQAIPELEAHLVNARICQKMLTTN